MCKLISCSNHSAFFDKKYCWLFLHQIIHSKFQYKHEISSNAFSLMHSENSLQPKTGRKTVFMLILTNVRIKKPIEMWKQSNYCLVNIRSIFMRVRKIAERDVRFVQSVYPCQPAWNNSAPTEQIFINIYIGGFFENLSRKFKLH
jgi:hypothetical protein